MDVYSLGVLLFVMLVGRKPWDAQRSHTLQYAVEATADAPGLQDPIFTALSPAAQQLVMLLLAEEPGDRPSAADVLNHAWMLQGIKVRTSSHLRLHRVEVIVFLCRWLQEAQLGE